MKKNRWSFLVLFPIAAFIFLALIELKIYPHQFWVDELYHVFAAIGILTTGHPLLPSGLLYERSIITTLLITGAFKVLGVSEFAARLPFLIIGILSITVTYFLVREIYTHHIALLTVFFLSISPWQLYWSTNVRMYILLQLLYLIFLYSGYKLLKELENRDLNKKRVSMLFVGLIAVLILTYYVHQFYILFIATGAAYLFYLAFKNLSSRNGIFKKRIPLLIFTISAILIFAALLYSKIPHTPTYTPIGMRMGMEFYTLLLVRYFPLYTLFAAVSVIAILWKEENRDRAPIVIFGFLVPFLLLSLLLDQKNSRYLFFTFPLLMAMAAHGVYEAWEKATRFRRKTLAKSLVLLAIALLLIQTCIGTYSMIYSDYQPLPYEDPHPHWRYASEYVEKNMKEDEIVLSTMPICTLYYLGKTDYWLRQNEYYGYIDQQGVLRDRYTGAMILKDYETFINEIKGKHGWIIADRKLESYFTDFQVQEYIKNRMMLHPEGSDETISVYRFEKA